MLTTVSQLSVRCVFNDYVLTFFRYFNYLSSPGFRYCNSGWIVKIRYYVDEFRSAAFSFKLPDGSFQLFRNHAIIIKIHPYRNSLVTLESLKSAKISR